MARTSNSPVTYLLRDPKARKPTPIICAVRFNNQRINVGTGFKVLPSHWDIRKSRVKNVVDAIDKEQINRYLENTEDAISSIITELKANLSALTKENVRARISAYLNPIVETVQPQSTEPALFTFIADFINRAPKRINPDTGKNVEYRTIQRYKTALNGLQEFAKSYRRKVDFDTIDLDFYEDFTTWLTFTKGYTVNNVGKYIQMLKTFLNEASAKGINVKQDYRSRGFKVVNENADAVFLSETEIEQLLALDLSKQDRLERVRDLFVVGCYTGLRFSDLTNLRPEYIKDGLIRIEQQKTADKVVIPCHEVVTQMLEKYNGILPRSISNQKMNDYLKEVCQLSGINTIESKAQTKGGKRVIKSVEKWQLVSTHTARRSFATNMYLLGIPALTIMQITGHRTEKAFMKYIKLDREQHAKVMALHWQNQRKAVESLKAI
ncbi:tyrosine-type recombinase/integrase [Rudanella paleaurantiibacter]|uniref:Tyrosine-type recombinase/integrase n=1 Tax=Rudanella paleaurantiibacter TaxID=2614655 RepID=A0A7J5U0L8_9BACT|nr:site-specific integrase [Rudanella paleaurantiibacter]KAB7731081.1 tyrosine-type recombinase/integrase [Rudanella paleaurantiibacter]